VPERIIKSTEYWINISLGAFFIVTG